eukprot:5889763-Karenia_brevis.AAC.1
MVRLLIGLAPAQLPCTGKEQSNCCDRAAPPHALGGWVHQRGPIGQSCPRSCPTHTQGYPNPLRNA